MASNLRRRFETYLIVNRKAPKTQQAYLGAVSRLANYYNRSPDQLSQDQVQDYLAYLIKQRKVQWSTCNVILCALHCFYNRFLNHGKTKLTIPPRPRQRKLPEVLSKVQVRSIIDNAKDLRHRAVLMMAYGSGLRVGEVVRLKPKDIESDRMMVRVEQAKGRKDRYSLLSKKALDSLRLYYKAYRPDAYLFVGKDLSQPLPIATAQKMYNYAKVKAGVNKGKGMHTLRHCFATHLLMQGVDIQMIKEFLGHRSIETTLTYLHIVPDRTAKIKSPLDEDE
jgi:integrase/recombinase XerD